MENKEITKLPPSGQAIGLKWFLFNWMKENLVAQVNKMWEVLLPPGAGTAAVRDSSKKVVIDLSKTNFVSSVVIENDDPDVTITGTVLNGVLTLSFVWTTTDCGEA